MIRVLFASLLAHTMAEGCLNRPRPEPAPYAPPRIYVNKERKARNRMATRSRRKNRK